MQAFRLCRSAYPAYGGEGARRVGWPLPDTWSTLSPAEQLVTKRLGDVWVEQQRSAVLSVPSVIVGERNYVLNPAHPDFA
jgi:RES domain-containing protein